MRKLLLAISIRHPHFLPIYPQASGKLHISTISVKTKRQLLVPIQGKPLIQKLMALIREQQRTLDLSGQKTACGRGKEQAKLLPMLCSRRSQSDKNANQSITLSVHSCPQWQDTGQGQAADSSFAKISRICHYFPTINCSISVLHLLS